MGDTAHEFVTIHVIHMICNHRHEFVTIHVIHMICNHRHRAACHPRASQNSWAIRRTSSLRLCVRYRYLDPKPELGHQSEICISSEKAIDYQPYSSNEVIRNQQSATLHTTKCLHTRAHTHMHTHATQTQTQAEAQSVHPTPLSRTFPPLPTHAD